MTSIVQTFVGSGTLPATRGILPVSQRGNEPIGQGVRTGVQTVLANPEDIVAVDAFAASGITVSTGVVEIVGPHTNPLPRSREIIVENVGAADVYLSHLPTFPAEDAFELSTEGTAGRSTRVTLPLLHNVSVYAKTAAGTTSVRLLIL